MAFLFVPASSTRRPAPATRRSSPPRRPPRSTSARKKLAGHVIATVRVGEDGRVRDVLVTENTTEAGFEPQLVKVLQSARFRPAIDASGKPVEGSVEMKVELRQSTGVEPKPVAAKPDPQLADKEKARIKKMRCSDFVWEWDLIREEAAQRRHRVHAAHRDHHVRLDAQRGRRRTWTPRSGRYRAKALREAVDQCRDNPGAPFWDGIFKGVMDAAVAE